MNNISQTIIIIIIILMLWFTFLVWIKPVIDTAIWWLEYHCQEEIKTTTLANLDSKCFKYIK